MKFSIITINYNNSKGLEKTIKSVINQKFSDYEFIIIDGLSSDDSICVIKKYSAYITYWVSEADKGIYHAMNKGIKTSKGEYLLFLNSGDFFYDNDVLMNVAKNDLYEDIICGATFSYGKVKYSPQEVGLEHFFSASMFHQSSFIKRELQIRFLYDETLKICSDYKFFIQSLILTSCTYRAIDVVISEYEGGGISEKDFSMLEKEKNKILNDLIPKRILNDYLMNQKIDFRRLFLSIEKSNFRKLIYAVNIFIIKFLKFFNKNHWIHKFTLKRKNIGICFLFNIV